MTNEEILETLEKYGKTLERIASCLERLQLAICMFLEMWESFEEDEFEI